MATVGERRDFQCEREDLGRPDVAGVREGFVALQSVRDGQLVCVPEGFADLVGKASHCADGRAYLLRDLKKKTNA